MSNLSFLLGCFHDIFSSIRLSLPSSSSKGLWSLVKQEMMVPPLKCSVGKHQEDPLGLDEEEQIWLFELSYLQSHQLNNLLTAESRPIDVCFFFESVAKCKFLPNSHVTMWSLYAINIQTSLHLQLLEWYLSNESKVFLWFSIDLVCNTHKLHGDSQHHVFGARGGFTEPSFSTSTSGKDPVLTGGFSCALRRSVFLKNKTTF